MFKLSYADEYGLVFLIRSQKNLFRIYNRLEIQYLARLFSKKTTRCCHSPGVVVVGGGVGVVQKIDIF